MKIIKETIFWLIVQTVLVLTFGYRINDFSGAFLFTSFLLPVLIATSYTFSEFLIPRYLLLKKYWQFGLFSFYTFVISLNLTILVMVLSFSVLANYRYDEMLPASQDVFGLALVIFFIALIKSTWKLVKRLFNQESEIQKLEFKEQIKSEGVLIVKADRKEYRIAHSNILYIESMSDYIKINQSNEDTIISREKISAIAERLPNQFLRIHRSYLINLELATTFTAENIGIGQDILPIGRKYKPDVKEILSTYK